MRGKFFALMLGWFLGSSLDWVIVGGLNIIAAFSGFVVGHHFR